MKRIVWLVTVAVLLVGCSGIAAAQCAGNPNPGGFDLLQTSSGTQDNLSSVSLGTVTFQGLSLPSADAGTTDTIICRITPLPNPIPPQGATLNIQIVALYLQSTGTVICNDSVNCGSYYGKPVTVYATINQTGGCIPTSQLPQYDSLTPSTGTMTVFPNGTFNTNSLTVQADLIVVPAGAPVTSTKIYSRPMPVDSITSSNSSWTSTEPAGYPNPPCFPAGGFYVNSFASPTVATLTSRAFRGSLYGLGVLLVGISVFKIRTSVRNGRLNLRPVYLLGLAAIAWFVGSKLGNFAFPMIAQAKAVCEGSHSVSVWVKEGGTYVVHVVQTANCSPLSTTTTVGPQ